jgi:hypothetical protein
MFTLELFASNHKKALIIGIFVLSYLLSVLGFIGVSDMFGSSALLLFVRDNIYLLFLLVFHAKLLIVMVLLITIRKTIPVVEHALGWILITNIIHSLVMLIYFIELRMELTILTVLFGILVLAQLFLLYILRDELRLSQFFTNNPYKSDIIILGLFTVTIVLEKLIGVGILITDFQQQISDGQTSLFESMFFIANLRYMFGPVRNIVPIIIVFTFGLTLLLKRRFITLWVVPIVLVLPLIERFLQFMPGNSTIIEIFMYGFIWTMLYWLQIVALLYTVMKFVFQKRILYQLKNEE